MQKIVLCADEETMRNPSLIGLEGESLESQQWIHAVSDAQEARRYVRSDKAPNEVWVASSNDVDPINLAAALKHDCCEKTVCLVAWQGTGSLMSRASAAGIDEVLSYRQLADRYARMKRGFSADNPRRRTPERAVAELRERQQIRDVCSCEAMEPDVLKEPVAVVREDSAPVTREEPVSAVGENSVSEAYEEPLRFAQTQSFLESDEPEKTQSCTDTRDDGKEPGAPWVAVPSKGDGGERRGCALTVVSASGGTGKSTVAVLSALIAASHGYRTLLIDGDLQFGDAAVMLGDEGALLLEKVMADPSCLDSAQPTVGKPVLVKAPEHLEHFEIYLGQLPGLIDRARESFDVVVVNTGSFWTESHIQLMEASSNTLFLVDQRPTSVKAVRRALELCSRCGVASSPFLFALNRCSRNSLLTSIDVSCALNGVAVAELKDGGSEVVELTGSGMASRLVEERNALCASLNDFLGGVIPAALGEKAPDDGNRKARAKRGPLHRRRKIACL